MMEIFRMKKIMFFLIVVGMYGFNMASDRNDGFKTPPRRPNTTLQELDAQLKKKRDIERAPRRVGLLGPAVHLRFPFAGPESAEVPSGGFDHRADTDNCPD